MYCHQKGRALLVGHHWITLHLQFIFDNNGIMLSVSKPAEGDTIAGGTILPRSMSKGTGSPDRTSSSRKGMVLPFEPLCMTFEDLRYAVDMPQVNLESESIVYTCFILLV